MSITGASETVAKQKLEEHGGNLNEAVNAHFSEGDRNIIHETSVAPLNDFMDVDEPSTLDPQRHFPLFPPARSLNPFSVLDPHFPISSTLMGNDSGLRTHAPVVSHPREVREIPIEVKDGDPSSHPTIEDVTDSADVPGPELRGTVIIDSENDEDDLSDPNAFNNSSHGQHPIPSAPALGAISDYANDIEAEMIQAAIEASKREAQGDHHDPPIGPYNDMSARGSRQRQPPLEDADLAHAVSLSLKTAEQEKALREQGVKVEELQASQSADVEELGKTAALKGKLDIGSSSNHDEDEDVEEQPLRRRSRRMSSSSMESAKETGVVGASVVSSPSSPESHDNNNYSENNGDAFPSDEWGGMSSVEHDEAVMLEAAMFGGISERSGYGVPYAPHQYMRTNLDGTVGSYPMNPRPPSPSLEAQRLIREQQDDEYLASLQADQEKEMMELAAREAALKEEKLKEEESQKKLEEEAEFERQLAAKEASLPREPPLDDDNGITLLVRMPDGSRRGRRFLKFDKLQSLFDFIDVGRGVKPGSYRLVRPYPRRAFTVTEAAVTLSELGLTSKQEALFLETI